MRALDVHSLAARGGHHYRGLPQRRHAPAPAAPWQRARAHRTAATWARRSRTSSGSGARPALVMHRQIEHQDESQCVMHGAIAHKVAVAAEELLISDDVGG